MDGFDDLLDTPSANPILDNPFEDPFARPRSPDPWLTFSQQHGDNEQQTAELASEPLSFVPEVSNTHSSDVSPTSQFDALDPLDAKAANIEDESDTSRLVRAQILDVSSSSHPSPIVSPIRKTAADSIPTPTSEPEPHSKPPYPLSEASPDQLVPSNGRSKTPTLPPQRSASPKLLVDHFVSFPPAVEATPSTPTLPPSPQHSSQPEPTPTPTRPTVVSPLDSGSMNGPASFATLALGGETPGWQGAFSHQPQLSSSNPAGSSGAWIEHENGEGFVNGTPLREETDEDDDIPIAKAQSFGQISSSNNTRAPEIQPMFVITVGDPQKVGDPMRPFITYTVHTRTTSSLYRRSSFSVLRRYSDFLWLYETLSNNNPGVIVPPVPEKQQYGRFQDTFVENRRAALNKCIQKTANHPSLRDDPDLKLFLESDSFVMDIKHRKAEIAHERGGLMASIGSTLVGPRFYETDEWFDSKKAYLDSLESQLRALVKSIDMVSKQRNEVALSMAEFAENIAALGVCDMSKQLSQTLSALADVQRKAKDLQDLQARADVSTIMSTVDEYARLVNSVRLAFTARVRLHVSWQNADNDVRRTQQAHEKARRQGRIPADRLSGSLAEIAETERRAMEAKQEFDDASKMIKSELARFEHERVEDFKNSLIAFLDGMITKQKEIIQSWESYQESLLKRLGNPSSPLQTSASK